MQSNVRETFNDGVLIILEPSTIRNEQRKKVGVAYSEIGRAFFNTMMLREQDMSNFDNNSSKSVRKVKTLLHPLTAKITKNELKIKIDNVIYDVNKVDFDRSYSYFFLSFSGGDEAYANNSEGVF